MNRIFSNVPTDGVFRTRLRTRFAETDLQGFIHHRYYLVYFEQARVEYFKSLGFDFRDTISDGLTMA